MSDNIIADMLGVMIVLYYRTRNRLDIPMNDSVTKAASDFLLGLARGTYDKELAEAEEALTAIGLPWAIMAREALHAFVTINRATAPDEVRPDGRGGFVPTTNSKIGEGGQFE